MTTRPPRPNEFSHGWSWVSFSGPSGLAFSPIGTRARGIGALAALAALVLVVAVKRVGVPWYFGSHLGLDNGIGG
jgi:hypothetical protein